MQGHTERDVLLYSLTLVELCGTGTKKCMSQPEAGAETQAKYLGIMGILLHKGVADAF